MDKYNSSSDEEPLIWENSNDGGYFTEWTRSSKLSDGNEVENCERRSRNNSVKMLSSTNRVRRRYDFIVFRMAGQVGACPSGINHHVSSQTKAILLRKRGAEGNCYNMNETVDTIRCAFTEYCMKSEIAVLTVRNLLSILKDYLDTVDLEKENKRIQKESNHDDGDSSSSSDISEDSVERQAKSDAAEVLRTLFEKIASGSMEDEVNHHQLVTKDLEHFHHNKVYSAMLNSLKQVTQDNKDLETESAILHELVEKLKYDLANTKEDADTEKINLSPLTSHLANFNEKYLKSGL